MVYFRFILYIVKYLCIFHTWCVKKAHYGWQELKQSKWFLLHSDWQSLSPAAQPEPHSKYWSRQKSSHCSWFVVVVVVVVVVVGPSVVGTVDVGSGVISLKGEVFELIRPRFQLKTKNHPFLENKSWSNWNDYYCILIDNRYHRMSNQKCIRSIHEDTNLHIVLDLKLLWLLVPVLLVQLLLVQESYSLFWNDWIVQVQKRWTFIGQDFAYKLEITHSWITWIETIEMGTTASWLTIMITWFTSRNTFEVFISTEIFAFFLGWFFCGSSCYCGCCWYQFTGSLKEFNYCL